MSSNNGYGSGWAPGNTPPAGVWGAQAYGLRPPEASGWPAGAQTVPPPGPPTPLPFAGIAKALVENNTVTLSQPPEFDPLVDSLTRYPSPQLQAQMGTGWESPESTPGDGWHRLTSWPSPGNARVPTGLWPTVEAALRQHGVQVQVTDLRQRPMDGVPYRTAIPLRPYQREAVEAALRAGRGVWDMVPRAGKTRSMWELHRCLSLPTVWIAPTQNIRSQTVAAGEEFFGPHYAFELKGGGWQEAASYPVVVTTAATAKDLPAEFYATRQVMVVDEFHHAAARTYHQIFARAPHIFYRFGMTGTFYRSGQDDLALHAVLANTIYKITGQQLVQLGYLAPADVLFLPVPGPRIRPGTSQFQSGPGKFGIFEHGYRNQLAVWAAATLWHRRRQVLVLVGTKVQGQLITEALRQQVPNIPGAHWKGVEFVSTDRPPDVCRAVIDSFVNRTGVQILVGTSMVGEGTDLPSADALVYAPGGKAEVSHTQAAFRVCTAAPGKRRAVIVDFDDRHHRQLEDHATERANTYRGESTFQVEFLQDPSHLPAALVRSDPGPVAPSIP